MDADDPVLDCHSSATVGPSTSECGQVTPGHALLTIRTCDEVPLNAFLVAAYVNGEWREVWRIVGVTVDPHKEV